MSISNRLALKCRCWAGSRELRSCRTNSTNQLCPWKVLNEFEKGLERDRGERGEMSFVNNKDLTPFFAHRADTEAHHGVYRVKLG
jgi:hypothetical protein